MPIRSANGYFNSPAFAQAASNLTALFEPPSGADAAGWADANAKKAAASRLADFYDYQKRPDYNQAEADRLGVGAGVYQPNQSYYAVDQGNATTQRGQDITAATSRANNTDDNTRALETNRLGELGKLFVPLNEGQVRPDLPADVAGQFGVTHDLPAAQGREKPLSETEVQGGLVQRMRDAGLIDDGMIVDRYVGDKTPVEAVGPDGKPRYMSPGAAVRAGAAPYDAPKGAGMTTTLPDGTVIQLGGSGGKPITEAQGKLVNYGTTAESMLPMLDKMGSELTDLAGNASTHVPGGYGNYVQSEGYQQARIVGNRFVQALLRNESGAATPDAEIAHYENTFLPQPGDKPGTIRLKSYLRKVGVEALKGGMTKESRLNAIDAALAAGPPPEGTTNRVAPAAAVTGAPASTASTGGPSQKAVDFLKANPSAAAQFDAKYGAGASARVLGGQ